SSQPRRPLTSPHIIFVHCGLVGLVASRGWKALRISSSDLVRIAILGLAGVAASNYFYYLAIQKTNVATAIIIQYTAPVWVLVYMVARGREHLTFSRAISVVLAVIGIALVIGIFGRGGGLQLNPLGVIASLVASFSFTYYNIAGHGILMKLDRWIVLLYTTLAAALFWAVVNPPAKIAAAYLSGAVWIFLLLFALTSVLVPFVFYFAGLQHLKPTNAIIASCLEPVFTILIAALALRETVGPLQALGIAMVLSAILVVQRPGADSQVQPAAGPVD
ncbi:MAG TPA: DMT family transporter, partial [Terriglobales bacterium]|nr:DMT family transporter [Terriglobales bacterium]